MTRIRVKVCGLTRVEDVRCADTCGVDAVGFIFAPSPRRVSPEAAAALDRAVSPWVSRIGVFVNPTFSEIDRVLDHVRLDALQLHGDETPQFVSAVAERYRRRIIKAVRVRDARSLELLGAYDADAYLLDTYVPGRAGGTGQTFDWRLIGSCAARYPIILSGGLTPENVADAVRQVRPYGVDVSSGVERAPGVKDHERIEAFVRNVRSLEATTCPR